MAVNDLQSLETGSRDEVRSRIAAALNERHPLYAGLSRNAADRLRGYLMARLGEVGAPDAALPYIREELELGDSPFVAAAAARALSGVRTVPDWAAAALDAARARFAFADDTIWFSPRAMIPAEKTTVLGEISAARNLTIKPECCCGGGTTSEPEVPEVGIGPLPGDVRLQDQTGAEGPYPAFFDAPVNVVAFFYTRCMNPAKCSATIEKLAPLSRALKAAGLPARVGAISYDPQYDIPRRLAAYGGNRDVPEDIPLLRATAGMARITDHFALGVAYGETTVNRHRVEAFLTDPEGRVLDAHLRRAFTVNEVVASVTRAYARPLQAG